MYYFLKTLEDMDTPNLRWHVVKTKPGCEKKVAELLSRCQYANYSPFVDIEVERGEFKKIYSKALFPSWVFVKISNEQLEEFKEKKGVVGFMYWMDQPAIVPEEELTMIHQFVNAYQNVSVKKSEVIDYTPIRVMVGPQLMDEDDDILIQDNVAEARLPSLGYTLYGTAKAVNVEWMHSNLKHANS